MIPAHALEGHEKAKPRDEAHAGGIAAAVASKEWVQSKANHQRIADLFLAFANEGSPELGALWGLKWCEVPERQASCSSRPLPRL